MKGYWLTLFICLFPASANAAVYFTEIAWMGSVESANHEWIELYNDGASVNIEGWQIVDNNNLSIDLVGTIPAGTRVVLERSSEASAPGAAFLIYTGSLVNSGATLRLLRKDGSLVDQVSGGTDWQNIGGDNETKDTPQYTTRGWTTGIATPGSDFAGRVSSVTDNKDTKDDISEANSTGAYPALYSSSHRTEARNSTTDLTLPGVTLDVSIKAPAVGYVNQPIQFRSTAAGIGRSLIESLEYEWNFGTGDVSQGESPEYVFRHPGTYVVTLFASYKRQEQLTKHEITILPVTLSLATNRGGDIVINNESKYEVDISSYRLAGTDTFIFPPRTFLLPNQSIVIERSQVISQRDGLVVIYDAEGVAINMLAPAHISIAETSPPRVIDRSPTPMISAMELSQPEATVRDTNRVFGFVSQTTTENQEIGESDVTPSVVTQDKINEVQLFDEDQSRSSSNQQWPYVALIGIILLAILAIVVTTRPEK